MQQRVGKIRATITSTEEGIEVDLKASATLPQTKYLVMALLDELANMQQMCKQESLDKFLVEYIARDLDI